MQPETARVDAPSSVVMGSGKAIVAGLVSGLLGGLVMTAAMLALANLFGVATPLIIIGDRLAVFIKPEPFLALMGRVGGYNQLKQLGVASTIGGQLVAAALAGAVYGWVMRDEPLRLMTRVTLGVFVLLPVLAAAVLLWPVLGTSYRGLPIGSARVVTLLAFAFGVLVFERTLVFAFHYLARGRPKPVDLEYSPNIGRRGILLLGLGVFAGAGAYGLLRKLYGVATFSYDGTQYKGPGVQPITPIEQFYCVTKNVVDPKVRPELWRLEITGLVQKPATYRIFDLPSFPVVDQETTLMCISNGLDAGLMSNALWRGVPLQELLRRAIPLEAAERVRFHAVDNYSDTIPLGKAMERTTLLAFWMNGHPLPNRHGFPARMIVPGYFGEKSVKWITRIELTGPDAKGFYETQGWGPNFIVPTRSRIDEPFDHAVFDPATAARGVAVRGVAFGGDRGISRVEVSTDDGATWAEARLDYPGTRLTWALWSYQWTPPQKETYALVVRATNGDGELQTFDPARPFKSGTTGFHRITVYVTG